MSEQCHEWVLVDPRPDDREHVLVCYLDVNHDGPHYDEGDDLTWKRGRP